MSDKNKAQRATFTRRLLALKPGETFAVRDSRERVTVCQIAQVLTEGRLVPYSIKTRANGRGGFTVSAEDKKPKNKKGQE